MGAALQVVSCVLTCSKLKAEGVMPGQKVTKEEEKKNAKKMGKQEGRSLWNFAGLAALIAAIGGIIVPIAIEIIRKPAVAVSPTPAQSPYISTIPSTSIISPLILMQEDFEDGSVFEIAMKRDSWQIINDPYSPTGNKVLEAESWDFIQFVDSKKWERYALEYQMKFFPDDISIMLAFDDNDPSMEGGCVKGESTHTILFNPDFIGLYNLTCSNETDEQKWNPLDFATPVIEYNVWHKIRLEVDEPNIRLWMDDILRIEYDLDQLNLHLDSRILRIYNKHSIQMDNIQVTELQ
jgi:hypothetical protein